MPATVHYDIVKHRGDWAVSIGGVVYDDAEKFAAAFPEPQYANTRFGCELDFSRSEMIADMVTQWA